MLNKKKYLLRERERGGSTGLGQMGDDKCIYPLMGLKGEEFEKFKWKPSYLTKMVFSFLPFFLVFGGVKPVVMIHLNGI